MYKNHSVAVVIPAYNEEKLIEKTIKGIPEFIDVIIAVNDASTDKTIGKLTRLAEKNSKLMVLSNERNGGTGYSLKRGFAHALSSTDAQAIGILSGDAQCPPDKIKPMLDLLIEGNYDYVKGNRFFDRNALKLMPRHRKIGNIFISLLTKFSTGYYSISDTSMGFGFLTRDIMERINFDLVRDRYDYENSMLVALSIADAKLKDLAVPAIYGEETSTINFWGTVYRVLKVIWVGFWQRIYYKYILYSFHPIALFLLSGLCLTVFGVLYGIYLFYQRFVNDISPSTGTVMLVVLPIILGIQLLLNAIAMDINNEKVD